MECVGIETLKLTCSGIVCCCAAHAVELHVKCNFMNLKLVTTIAFALLVIVVNNLAPTATWVERLTAIAVSLSGFHMVYGYLFNTQIHMTGYTVPVGERPILRILLGFIGAVMIGLSAFWLLKNQS